MQVSSLPRKFNLPFAENAGGSFSNYPIPDTPSGTPGAASLSTGFPQINFTPISAGGIPPFGADFNALMFQVTSWNQWQAAGGPIFYDSAFQTAIGGYPNGAVIQSAAVPGNFWQSTTDNNTSNPDTGGANWITPPWAKGTGDIAFRPTNETLTNHVVLNGTTVGNSGSGASQLASSSALLIYQYLWNKFSNTICPVTGGRGANALADFNANKPIATPQWQGIGVAGVDTMGGVSTTLLSGVPAQSGSATVPASILGENLHTLITAELAVHSHANSLSDPSHTHSWSVTGGFFGGTASGGSAGGANDAVLQHSGIGGVNGSSITGITLSNANTGSGNAHNNFQRNVLGFWYMHI